MSDWSQLSGLRELHLCNCGYFTFLKSFFKGDPNYSVLPILTPLLQSAGRLADRDLSSTLPMTGH